MHQAYPERSEQAQVQTLEGTRLDRHKYTVGWHFRGLSRISCRSLCESLRLSADKELEYDVRSTANCVFMPAPLAVPGSGDLTDQDIVAISTTESLDARSETETEVILDHERVSGYLESPPELFRRLGFLALWSLRNPSPFGTWACCKDNAAASKAISSSSRPALQGLKGVSACWIRGIVCQNDTSSYSDNEIKTRSRPGRRMSSSQFSY